MPSLMTLVIYGAAGVGGSAAAIGLVFWLRNVCITHPDVVGGGGRAAVSEPVFSPVGADDVIEEGVEDLGGAE